VPQKSSLPNENNQDISKSMIVQSENIQPPLSEVTSTTVNALQTAINGNVSKSIHLPQQSSTTNAQPGNA
jgi:hypothetical protein